MLLGVEFQKAAFEELLKGPPRRPRRSSRSRRGAEAVPKQSILWDTLILPHLDKTFAGASIVPDPNVAIDAAMRCLEAATQGQHGQDHPPARPEAELNPAGSRRNWA